MNKFLSSRSLLIVLSVVVLVLFGVVLLRRSAGVSARRATACAKEGQQGGAVPGGFWECCPGLVRIGVDEYEETFTCAKCGNGKCGPGETQLNCGKDCVSCLKEGEQGEAPLTCCRGLTLLGTENGFICTKCGNKKCGIGESSDNCPQDCKPTCVQQGSWGVPPAQCCKGLTLNDFGGEFLCTKCGDRTCDRGEEDTCARDCQQCVQQGSWGVPPAQCCKGLTLNDFGGEFLCTKCGDGTCERGEAIDGSCPHDC